VCVLEPESGATVVDGLSAAALFNVKRLRRRWELQEQPLIYVDPGAAARDFGGRGGKVRIAPRAGDLVLPIVQSSVLRDARFRNFYADVGRPPIVLIGMDLEGTIAATARDANASRSAVTIVGDAVFARARLLKERILKRLERHASIVDSKCFLPEEAASLAQSHHEQGAPVRFPEAWSKARQLLRLSGSAQRDR
jgi:hypothetical protein